METLILIAGRKKIPVQIEKVGRKITLKSPYNRALVDEFRSMKGAQWDAKKKCWAVSDCRRNWIQLECLRGILPVEFERYMTPPPEVEVSRPLYAHQRALLNFAYQRRGVIWAAEQGVGKSLSAIELMDLVGGDWWWIAPAKVCAAVSLELDKWEARTRPMLLSYAKLRRYLEEKRDTPLGVIFDESSRLKSPGAQRTKAAMHIADAVREERDGYVVLMSGSPAPKDPCDWWAQAEIACPGWLRESNVSTLRKRLAIIETVEAGDRTFPKLVDWKVDEVTNLKKRLAGITTVVLSKDCQDLPEIRYETIEIKPKKNLLVKAKVIAAQAMTAVEALSEVRQLSDGFRYREGDQCEPATSASDTKSTPSAPPASTPPRNDSGTGSPKATALRSLLSRYEESGRLIVYAGFRQSIEIVTEVCKEEGWEVLRCDGRGWKAPKGWTTEDALKEMDLKTNSQAIEKLAFVAHPASGGMGLTLTASPAAVFYSNDFNFESRIQAEKRGHREGMDERRGFVIWDLLHLPTDQLVLTNLRNKRALQALTLEDVLEVLK